MYHGHEWQFHDLCRVTTTVTHYTCTFDTDQIPVDEYSGILTGPHLSHVDVLSARHGKLPKERGRGGERMN